MGRTKHQFRCDDTMTKCDGTPPFKSSITVLYCVSYHSTCDDDGQKLKTNA